MFDSSHPKVSQADLIRLQGQQLTPLVTAQLPSPLSSPSISLFAYLSSLIHHLGQVHAFIRKPLDLSSTKDTQAWYSEFRVHDERLLGWWMCLPEKVKRLERGDWREGDGEGGLKALINTAFFATMIRLQSAAAYPPVSSPSFLPSESAGISCLSAARSMSRVAILVGRHASPSGSSNGPIDARDLSPLFGWTCWVGARALVAHAYISESAGRGLKRPSYDLTFRSSPQNRRLCCRKRPSSSRL